MPGYKSAYAELTECGYCHNGVPSEDISAGPGKPVYCSTACAVLADEAAGRSALGEVICTNCEAACLHTEQIVFSEDGLPFCGDDCADRYPKMVNCPEMRRVLCTAAAGMFLAAGFAVLAISGSLSALARHP